MDLKLYLAIGAIRLDGRKVKPGEKLELTEAQARSLSGFVSPLEGSAPEMAAAPESTAGQGENSTPAAPLADEGEVAANAAPAPQVEPEAPAITAAADAPAPAPAPEAPHKRGLLGSLFSKPAAPAVVAASDTLESKEGEQ